MINQAQPSSARSFCQPPATHEFEVRHSVPIANDSAAMSRIGDAFRVDDDMSANWVVRRITEARAYARRVEAWAATEIRRAEADERYFLARFGGQLEQWLRQAIAREGSRRKSVPLPAGTVGLRKAQDRLEVIDSSQVMAWARQHLPGAIRVTVNAAGDDAVAVQRWCQQHLPTASVEERVSKSDLNEHVQRTGELPEGATHLYGTEQLSVK